MFLLEARVDFAADPRSVIRMPLRPLPVHCSLPRMPDEPAQTIVGWISGALYSSATYAITVSSTSVSDRTPETVRSDPTIAFGLDDPARKNGLVYLCDEPHGSPEICLERFLSGLRYDDCLDMAGINDSRGRTMTSGERRSSRKPAFVRVGATNGPPSIKMHFEALGRVRRPYCLVEAVAPVSSWPALADAVVDATRAAIGDGAGLFEEILDERLQGWWTRAVFD